MWTFSFPSGRIQFDRCFNGLTFGWADNIFVLNVFDPSLPEINYFRSGKAQFPNNMNFKNLPEVFEIFEKKNTQQYYAYTILEIRDIEVKWIATFAIL